MGQDLKELLEVIKPFVNETEHWDGYSDDENLVEPFGDYEGGIKVLHLRNALKLYNKLTKG